MAAGCDALERTVAGWAAAKVQTRLAAEVEVDMSGMAAVVAACD